MTFWTRSPRRASLIGGGLLVATFLTGGLAGAAADRAARDDGAAADCRDKRRDRDRDAWLERLDLSPTQRTEVEAILERRRSQMGAFWREHKHQLHAIVDSTRAEVRAVLTPEQLAEEERIWAERRGREKSRDARDGSGGE